VGLDPLPSNKILQDSENKPTKDEVKKSKVTDLYRSVSQDDMMGYEDDEY
jgi:hypothetical protein